MIIPKIGIITNVILNITDLKSSRIQEEIGKALKNRSLHTMPKKMREEPFCQAFTDDGDIVNIYLKIEIFELVFNVVAIQPRLLQAVEISEIDE